MKFKIPNSTFDQNLKEQPVDKLEWEKFIENASKDSETIATEKEKLPYYEILGHSHRILKNLGLAEEFLKKAVALSAVESPAKQLQNLIRLAHVYQDQKQFKKSKALFDQARELLNFYEVSDTLRAAYHQHLGKYYFDQSFYGLSLTEFELAYKIRLSVKAPRDQIESTELALSFARKKSTIPLPEDIIIRRAEVDDAEAIHIAHMKSINEICVKDHSPDEIRVWSRRSYNPDIRLPAIKDYFYLVVQYKNKIEGFCHLKLSHKEDGPYAYLYGLDITPVILKKKVGHALMMLIEEYCHDASGGSKRDHFHRDNGPIGTT